MSNRNLNTYNLQLEQEVLLDGEKCILKDFIDELTCEVEKDLPTCYTRPENTFMNRVCRFIGWPESVEIVYDTYRGRVLCSIYMLDPVPPDFVYKK